MIKQPADTLAKKLQLLARTEAGQALVRYLADQEVYLMRASVGAQEEVRCRQLQGGALTCRALLDALQTDTVSSARR